MTTTVARVPASFRFQSTLIDELKSKAKASNRSLNNYVESLLISILHPGTNELQVTTDKVHDDTCMNEKDFLAKVEHAISDVRNGHSYSMLPDESLDEFMNRMEREGNV